MDNRDIQGLRVCYASPLSCVRLFATPWIVAHQAPLSMGVLMGSHDLLQGIFPTQGWKPGLPHRRWILYCQSHQGNPWVKGVNKKPENQQPGRWEGTRRECSQETGESRSGKGGHQHCTLRGRTTPVVTLESEDPSGGVRAKAVCTGSRENGQENGVRGCKLHMHWFHCLEQSPTS